ncbi:MAG: hypothetical protein AB3N13_15460 [Arenibacterium sp.]
MLSLDQRSFIETYIMKPKAPTPRGGTGAEAPTAPRTDGTTPPAPSTSADAGSATPPPVPPRLPYPLSETVQAFTDLEKDAQKSKLVAFGLSDAKAQALADDPAAAEQAFKHLTAIKDLGIPAARSETLLEMATDKPDMFRSAMLVLNQMPAGSGVDLTATGVKDRAATLADDRLDYLAKADDEKLKSDQCDEKEAAYNAADKAHNDMVAAEDARMQTHWDAYDAANKEVQDQKALIARIEEALRNKDKRATPELLAQAQQELEQKRAARQPLMEKFDAEKAIYDQRIAATELAANNAHAAWVTAYNAWDGAVKAREAAETKRNASINAQDQAREKLDFLNDLSFGSLSKGAKPALNDAQGKLLLDAYARDPGLAKIALATIKNGGDAAAVTANIGPVLDKLADGFADENGQGLPDTIPENDRRVMAMNVLKAGAAGGQAYFDGFFDYLKSGAQNQPDTCALSEEDLRAAKADPNAPGLSDKEREDILQHGADRRLAAIAVKRTAQLSQAMIDGNGDFALSHDLGALKTARETAEAKRDELALEVQETTKLLATMKKSNPSMAESMASQLDDVKKEHERAVAAAETAKSKEDEAKRAKEATSASQAHMMYHPGSLIDYTPQLNKTMDQTVKLMTDPATSAQAKAILDKTGAPNPSGTGIVADTLGVEPGSVGANEAKAAVLSAMMTPLSQGPVGSCFSTGPVRAMKEDRPLEAMDRFSEMATSATFTPKDRAPIPGSTRVPPGENKLMRAVEYSAATAGCNIGNTYRRNNLTNATNAPGALDSLKGALGIPDDEWIKPPAIGPDGTLVLDGAIDKLKAGIRNRLSFDYNADIAATPGSGDGNSDSGGFQILFDNATRITTEAEFEAAVIAICQDALGKASGTPEGDQVEAAIKTGSFMATIKAKYDPNAPWKLSSGGFDRETKKAMEGGNPVDRRFTAARATGDATTEGARTKAMVTEFAKSMQGKSGMSALSTDGDNCNHAFNAITTDPIIQGLLKPVEGGGIDVDQRLNELMLTPGRAVADEKLPLAQAQALYRKGVDQFIAVRSQRNDRGMDEIKDLYAKGPSTEMTAQEVVDHMNTELDKLVTLGFFNQEYMNDMKEACAAQVDADLMLTRDTPEMIMADTNWGDANHQVYFVVRTDPRTGELKQYKKYMPDGTYAELGKNWKDADWYRLEG